MALETIIATGQVCYRTKLMDLTLARSFARCLDANTTRFANVRIHRSEKAKTEKYFVTFQPSNSDRQSAMHQRQWDARAERVASQEFMFWQDCDNRHIYWCYSVASGETYQVTLGDCTCPDYHYRCRIAGLKCKHMIAWSLGKAAGIIVDAPAGASMPFPISGDAEIDAFAEAIY